MGAEADRCRDCAFHSRNTYGTPVWDCDYLILTGKPRGCSSDHCIRYLKRTAKIDKEYQRGKWEVREGYKAYILQQYAYPGKPVPTPFVPAAPHAAPRVAQPQKAPKKSTEECMQASSRRYYESHRDEIAKRNRQYREKHREAIRAYNREYNRKKKEREAENV